MHLFLGRRCKAQSEPSSSSFDVSNIDKALKKRCSRVFRSNAVTSPRPASEVSSPKQTTRHKLRVKASRFLAKMMPPKGDVTPQP